MTEKLDPRARLRARIAQQKEDDAVALHLATVAARKAQLAVVEQHVVVARTSTVEMLSLETRRKMHELGWESVRQTQIATGRECPAELLLALQFPQTEWATPNQFLGSVLHTAIERADETLRHGIRQDYWIGLMLEQHRRQPVQTDRFTLSTRDLLTEWARRFCDVNTYGIEMVDLVGKVIAAMRAAGWKIVSRELLLEYTDGEEYPVRFHGTIDLVVELPSGELLILDVKSFGLWARILSDDAKGSMASQSYERDEILWDPQLQSYLWLYGKVKRKLVAGYGLVMPVNGIPLLKNCPAGPKGADRGRILQVWRQDNPGAIGAAYQNNLVDTITSWIEGGFYRAMPRAYGKAVCPDCRYFKYCVGDLSSSAHRIVRRNVEKVS